MGNLGERMRLVFLLLAFCSFSFAQFEEALEAHHSAAKNEDWDAYIATFDTTGMNSTDMEAMRKVAAAVWQRYDTESYSISNVSDIVQGDEALVQYHLTAEISGAENASVDDEYMAFFHLVGSDWKIVYTLPLSDYLELTESAQRMKTLDAVSEVVEAKENQSAAATNQSNGEGQNQTKGDGEGQTGGEGCLPAFALLAALAALMAKE